MRNLLILLVASVLLGACNASYEKTNSGLRYKIIKGKGGEKINNGDFIKFNQIVAIPERDTVISSTYGKMAGYVKIDTGARAVYSFVEVLPKMRVGDSAVIIFSVDSLKAKNMIPDYDNVFRKGGQVSFRMRIIKKYTNEAEVNAEYQKEMQADSERRMKEAEVAGQQEVKDLEQYLNKNNIKATKTPAGAFVEITEPGTSPKLADGMVGVIYYTGKLFKDGTTFDSNVDPKFNHTDPLNVTIGANASIKGFEDGLKSFGKGGRGRIFIPSYLGYGPQGAPPVIPPNSTLIFEVEVRDIQAAAANQPSKIDPH